MLAKRGLAAEGQMQEGHVEGRVATSDALPPVIVTVHGTNDQLPHDRGERWWQIGSEFSQKMTAALAERGISDVEIRPLRWSGQNSDFDRLVAARALAGLLRQLEREQRPHAVLAHSHGGNVTMEAVAQRSRAHRLGGVVSFGTPFFIRRLKTVPAVIAVFQVVLGIVIAPIMVGYLAYAVSSGTSKILEAAVVFGGLLAIAIWSAWKGLHVLAWRWLARWRCTRTLRPNQWLVVHSPRDEAMRLLETAAAISPQYVTVGAAMRSLTSFARLAAVAGTIAIFAWTASYFLEPIVTKVRAGNFGFATAVDFTFLLLIPVVYGALFGILWLLARLGGAWLWARTLTAAIQGGVVGAAYGGDASYVLKGVTSLPPHVPSPRDVRLDAVNLGGVDDAAIFVAAQRLYGAVVAKDELEGGLADPDTMWKHLSDALYHNAYMRDDDVIAGVADHLADEWLSSPSK
jgi:hypothetical protein